LEALKGQGIFLEKSKSAFFLKGQGIFLEKSKSAFFLNENLFWIRTLKI
jgi:hypothetical protein